MVTGAEVSTGTREAETQTASRTQDVGTGCGCFAVVAMTYLLNWFLLTYIKWQHIAPPDADYGVIFVLSPLTVWLDFLIIVFYWLGQMCGWLNKVCF